MGYIGHSVDNFETIEDRKTHTGDGTTTKFGVLYSDNNVSVFQNGIKLKETTDYSTDASGTFVTLIVAPSTSDVIDLVGTNSITSLAHNSHIREKLSVSGTAATTFTLSTNTTIEDNVVVYLNGVRLHTDDYTFTTAKTIVSFAVVNV